MTGPTDPKYINSSEEEKIRYFFNWLIEKTKMKHSSKDLEDIINESIKEWKNIKAKYPDVQIDDFIAHLADFSAMSMLLMAAANMASPSPSPSRYSNN